MNITEEYTGFSKVKYILEYSDCDDFSILPKEKCTQTYGVCFVDDQMVIGYGGVKKNWGLIGGTVEPGESFDETFAREIKEEANMEVLSKLPIGYQKVTDTRDGSFVFQLRYVSIVRPYGPFVSDPAGGITEIALIAPSVYTQYFNWGKIGERIISRALELKQKL